MNRPEALRAVAVAIDSLAEIVGELDGDKISDDLHEATAAIAGALDVLRARPSPAELLAAVSTELDVEIFALGQGATTRRVLDPEEREGLVAELADSLGVAHAGCEAYSVGTLSIDPTEPIPEAEVVGVEIPEILLDPKAVAGVFRACATAARAMADRFDVTAIPRPLPASSKALRQHRTEVDLVVDYVSSVVCPVHELDDPDCRPSHGGCFLGRHRRRTIETGRFRTSAEARRWAVARLVELDPEANPEAVLYYLSASDGWTPHDAGRVTLAQAREELDR